MGISLKAVAGPWSSGALLGALALLGCATPTQEPPAERAPRVPPAAAASASTPPSPSAPAARRGGYYQDDGPGDSVPPNLDSLADAEPRVEALHRFANNPYVALGRDYVPERTAKPFRQRGVASWYGRKFHGQGTSSGEAYDMYAMTAAHPTLPIPSYARVTNIANGRSVVVRINDRGPFLHNRIIDLSYAAAYKLGYADRGSALVEVEAILSGQNDPAAATRSAAPPPNEVAQLPITAESGGIYLQLGAFAARVNAESFAARLTPLLEPLTHGIDIYQKDGLFRLHVGPYRDRAEARAAGDRIRDSLAVSPHLVVR